jgi:hypothetical protein
MAANRKAPAHQLPAETAVEPEKGSDCHDRTTPKDAPAPRAGRTGGLGARAERPNEGTRRKPADKEPTRRGAKAPSARKAPHSEDRSSR